MPPFETLPGQDSSPGSRGKTGTRAQLTGQRAKLNIKLLSIPCSLILLGLLLTSFAGGLADRVKARVKSFLRPQYLRVYAGEGVAGSLHAGSDVIHGSDDFLSKEISSKNWVHMGHTPPVFLPRRSGHQGGISISSGTTTGVNELIGKQVSAGPSSSFSGITKCVVRFVVSCDALFTATGGFDGEWYVGIASPDGTGNVYAGAMLSFAPGFDQHPSTQLLAGSYTSQSSNTETPTTFSIAPNTWYDLTISWTPTAIRYYAAVHGQIPTLIATNTTNISTEPQYLLIGNNRYKNGTPSVNLLIDKVEWLYTTSADTAQFAEHLLTL